MTSAIAIDGRSGPNLPRDYAPKRQQQRQDRQSPLPEDWSEITRPLRQALRELRLLVE